MSAGTAVVVIFICHMSVALTCSTHERWKAVSMEERLYRSLAVVIGKEVKHVEVETLQGLKRVDSVFEVHCILKNTRGGMPRNITIERISPRECSGTVTAIGKEVIVGIKRLGNMNFEWHELNSLQTAAFPATEENIGIATQICGLTEPEAPYDRSGRENDKMLVCPMNNLGTESNCHTGKATTISLSKISFFMSLLIYLFIS